MARLRIYTDENVDIRVADGLRRRGVDARSAAAIFTHDHHLVEVALEKSRRGEEHYGVIFAEMHRLGLGECIRRLGLCSDVLSAEEMKNRVEFL